MTSLTTACRVCGCTDADCSKCIERTGRPCVWVAQDLCSACEPFAAAHETTKDVAAQIAEQLGAPGVMLVILDPVGHLHVGAVAADDPITENFVGLARLVEAAVSEVGGPAPVGRGVPPVGSTAPPARAACIHCRQDVAALTDLEAIRHHAMTCASSPVVQRNAELQHQLELAHSAIAYALNRVQTDPDFAYYMLHTETFAKLVAAEADIMGFDPAAHYKLREEDRQPEHRRREPEIVVLRDKLEEARRVH